MESKTCTACQHDKPATAEHFKPKADGTLLAKCRPCLREYDRVKKWEQAHPGVPVPPRVEPVPDGHKLCTRCNTVKPRTEFFKRGYCKPCTTARVRDYRRRNPEFAINWRKTYKPTPAATVAIRVRCRIINVLRGRAKPGATFDLLGYTPADLVRHIERTWKPGMSWENYGPVWHIDHILPCALFDHTDPDMIRQCWALTNLRALWKRDNLTKKAKRLHLI